MLGRMMIVLFIVLFQKQCKGEGGLDGGRRGGGACVLCVRRGDGGEVAWVACATGPERGPVEDETDGADRNRSKYVK